MDRDKIWSDTLQTLQQQMTRATYDVTLSQSCLAQANGTFVVQVVSDMAQEWLSNRLAGVVAGALGSVIGQPVSVDQLKFVNGAAAPLQETNPKPAGDEAPLRIRDRRKGHRYMIDREFVFNGFAAILGPYAIAVYNVLVAAADNDNQDGKMYYSTIAKLSGMSRRQAIEMVALLENHRLVCVEHKADGKSANEFALADVSEWRL